MTRDGRSPFAGLALALAMVGAVAVAGGCAGEGGTIVTYPPASARPPVADSPAVASTRAELVRVLGDQNLVLADAQVPFRPAEGPALAGSPRAVYQVILPDDPGKGYIVVYELRDPPTAVAAGADQASYLGTGPGRVQMPIGARHVLRQVGSTIVLYSWVPDGSTDARADGIPLALETLGIPITVPS
ncbi:MAG: hypothetical protein WEC14_08045 [Chloroflexota bacterium]